jgi:HEAT repeat protein
MNFQEILNDKLTKPKQKTEEISGWILENPSGLSALIEFATKAKDAARATCIEAIEYATSKEPAIADRQCLEFVIENLKEKAPRIKWESAKVIGNIAHLYPGNLDEAVKNLLVNSEHSGTVVRWSAAFALGRIIKLNSTLNKELIPAVESICNREEKNSIRKIYQEALKKSKI